MVVSGKIGGVLKFELKLIACLFGIIICLDYII
jgi:hypothetical protein